MEKETPDSGLLEELKQLRAKIAELEHTKVNDNSGVGQLDASEERFRLLVENVVDYAIFQLDTKGVISTWNAGAQKIKGYTSEEIIGKSFAHFMRQMFEHLWDVAGEEKNNR